MLFSSRRDSPPFHPLATMTCCWNGLEKLFGAKGSRFPMERRLSMESAESVESWTCGFPGGLGKWSDLVCWYRIFHLERLYLTNVGLGWFHNYKKGVWASVQYMVVWWRYVVVMFQGTTFPWISTNESINVEQMPRVSQKRRLNLKGKRILSHTYTHRS